MKPLSTAMSLFHPLVADWFQKEIGLPTDVQNKAWPGIADGEHVLVSAPTGSGKTLTAFLWALNNLITGVWTGGVTRVIYVSPLKALNNDIQRNLTHPLISLKKRFEETGEPFPSIQVMTRSGDTSSSDRRRMLRHPPEILVTTPESLNLMLSSLGGRSILHQVRSVILDEIHGVVNSKRGVHLMTAVERLVSLSGEFQRISLSATIRPLETVARFVGGYRLDGDPSHPSHIPRKVSIIRTDVDKHYLIHVCYPESAVNRPVQQSIWVPLVESFNGIVQKNRSTLLFVNSRKLCEKITYLMNHENPNPVAYAHHGSLSREIRHTVEQKMKDGKLQAIVATNSLEMGIDIGSLDEVVLIQTPRSVSSAIQRIGRAGHQVGETSRGVIFPTHSQDLVEAAVLSSAILSKDIEEVRPVEAPLDILAQIIISMTGVETWNIDDLYLELRRSYSYHDLTRTNYDRVLMMLSGRYAETSIRELKPRVSIDEIDQTVSARKGALLALYMSGGTIPDRGYYQLRHSRTQNKIGELDEEFVWEARVGQVFTLGTQNWKIHKITHNDVLVEPWKQSGGVPPFWIAEESNRNIHFSRLIGEFLETANDRLDSPDYLHDLKKKHHMDETAAQQLVEYLKRQKEVTGSPLPHRHHLLVEFVKSPPGKTPGHQIIIHTFWGGTLNRPYAMALKSAWEERYGKKPEVFTANDCLFLILPKLIRAEELMGLVTSASVESQLRKQLEKSGTFGARFRECAGRALLLSKKRINERMPLWVSRLRSKELLDEVLPYEDFPILLEAWRTCLKDEFDMENLYQVLSKLETGDISWSETTTSYPSPMALNMTWRQINKYMYMGDKPEEGKQSGVRDDILHDMVFTNEFRPRISGQIISEFQKKKQRTFEGFSPDSAEELLEFVKERRLIPEDEWNVLLERILSDHKIPSKTLLKPIRDKLTSLHLPGTPGSSIIATQEAEWVLEKRSDENPEGVSLFLKEWLPFYGPLESSAISKTVGLYLGCIEEALSVLVESGDLVSGKLVKDSESDYFCDSRNFEMLLRKHRIDAIPLFEPLEEEWLQVFLMGVQGLSVEHNLEKGLEDALEQLVCYPAPADLWETEVFPSRCAGYRQEWLDAAFRENHILWIGLPNRNLMFCYESDLDLTEHEQPPVKNKEKAEPAVEMWFTDPVGRYDFAALHRVSGTTTTWFTQALWEGVWRGSITNDTFAAIRKGIEHRFKAPQVTQNTPGTSGRRRRPAPRSGFSRWKGSLPSTGNWFLIHPPSPEEDLLEREEQRKERARILLDRYGLLFRELLMKEQPGFRWGDVFRSLRLMELSGEILSGCFFHGIPGLQFISKKAFRLLSKGLEENHLFWINATDPASLCGVPLATLKSRFPKRLRSTHLVFHGNRLILTSEKLGKALTFHVDSDHPDVEKCLILFQHLLNRSFNPMKKITIETINENPSNKSPYTRIFEDEFDVVKDYKGVAVYRRVV